MHRRFFLQGLAASTLMTMFPFASAALSAVTEWDSFEEGTDTIEAASPSAKALYCPGILRLSSTHHKGSYTFKFRDEAGNYDNDILASLNWFLRCGDGTWQYMDIGTVEMLNYMSKTLGDPLILVHSAYRSPQYNAKIENAARNSLHMYGKAVDFSVPGISIREVCSHSLLARNTAGRGGVGYYPGKGFVHLDSGAYRQWLK